MPLKAAFVLVVLGLLISIPIMVLGSTIILRLVDRYSFIIYVGAAVLAWTAAKMLTQEPWLEDIVSFHRWVPWAMQGLVVGGVLLAGFLQNRPTRRAENVGSLTWIKSRIGAYATICAVARTRYSSL